MTANKATPEELILLSKRLHDQSHRWPEGSWESNDLIAAADLIESLVQKNIDLNSEQIEAYRAENRISMEPPLPQWAVEENTIMDALCDFALHSLATGTSAATEKS